MSLGDDYSIGMNLLDNEIIVRTNSSFESWSHCKNKEVGDFEFARGS